MRRGDPGGGGGGAGGGAGWGGMVEVGGGESARAADGRPTARQEAIMIRNTGAEKVAFLLTNGSYLCKMRVQCLPVPHAGAGGGVCAASWLLQQTVWHESPWIDLTHSVSIEVRCLGGLGTVVRACACVSESVCSRLRKRAQREGSLPLR